MIFSSFGVSCSFLESFLKILDFRLTYIKKPIQNRVKKGLKLLETFRLFHLQINASKTKTMILNFKCFMDQLCIEQPYPESIVKLNNQVIENVEVFRYLGDDIRFDQPSTRMLKLI